MSTNVLLGGRRGKGGGSGYYFNLINYFMEISPTAVQTRINNGDVIILQKNSSRNSQFSFCCSFIVLVRGMLNTALFPPNLRCVRTSDFAEIAGSASYNRAIERGQLKYSPSICTNVMESLSIIRIHVEANQFMH